MNLKAIFFFVICISFTFCKNEPTNQKESTTPLIHNSDKLDEYFSALTKLKKFNGCVLVHQNGKEIFKKAFNISDKKDSSLYVTLNSQFDIRSVSKLMAKASIIQLEKDGKIKRTDFLNKHIPDFPNGDKITIEHLILNQSGLPRELVDFEGNEFDLTIEQVIDLAKKQKLEFEPGTDGRYSNIGYQVLYYIIGQTTNTTFPQHLQNHFFDRLQMDNSGSHFYADNDNLKNYAYGHYTNNDDEIISIKDFQSEEMKMGKIYSTVEDLMSFLKYVSKEPFASEIKNKKGIIGHAGGADGKRAYIHSNPTLNYEFIFLTNYESIPFQKITEDVQKILENKPYVVPKEVNRKAAIISTAVLKKYAGLYDFAELEHLRLDIKFEEGKLVAYQNGNNAGVLVPETETIFFSDPKSAESLEFKKTDNNDFKLIMDFKGAKWEGLKVLE